MVHRVRILRHIAAGAAFPPPSLMLAEMAYNRHDTGDDLYIGDGTEVRTLISATRQLELTGAQTIAAGAAKTFDLSNLRINGGNPLDCLTRGAADGDLTWGPVIRSLTIGDGLLGDAVTSPLRVDFATDLETHLGTYTTKSITPANLRAELGAPATSANLGTTAATIVPAIAELGGRVTFVEHLARLVGTYNVATNVVTPVAGSPLGGGALPPGSPDNLGYYVVANVAGTGTGAAPPVAIGVGDMLFSTGSAWQLIAVNLGAVFVALAGGTMTGNLAFNGGTGISYNPAAIPGANNNSISFGWTGATILASVDGTGTPGALATQAWVGAAYLPLIGGAVAGSLTVTGALTANGSVFLPAAAPVAANQATSKAYVDAAVAGATGSIGNYLPLAGGTLTGSLTIAHDTPLRFTSTNSAAGYGVILHHGGTSTFVLLTNFDDALGGWNTLRPLRIDNTTGNVSFGHAVDVSGTLYAGGNISSGDNITATNNINTLVGNITAVGHVIGEQLRFANGAWAWYAPGGTAALWYGSDQFTVTVAGLATAAGGVHIPGGALNVVNNVVAWANGGTTFYNDVVFTGGSTSVSAGSFVVNNAFVARTTGGAEAHGGLTLIGGGLNANGQGISNIADLAITGNLTVGAAIAIKNMWLQNDDAGWLYSHNGLRAPDLMTAGSLWVGGVQVYNPGDGTLYAGTHRGYNLQADNAVSVGGVWMSSDGAGGVYTARYNTNQLAISGISVVNDGTGALYTGSTIRGGALQSDTSLLCGTSIQANGGGTSVIYVPNGGIYVAGDSSLVATITLGAIHCNTGAYVGGELQIAGHVRTGSHISPTSNNDQWCGHDNAWFNVTSYGFQNMSDPAEKRDIHPVDIDVTDYITRINPCQFHWRDGPDTGHTHWGFLAPEVRAIMGEDFGGCMLTPQGLEGLASHEMVAILWRGVQQIITRIGQLEERHGP